MEGGYGLSEGGEVEEKTKGELVEEDGWGTQVEGEEEV